jgi:hypothetical protein
MATPVNQEGGGGRSGGGVHIPPTRSGGSSLIGANPGLITSTGGLVGVNGLLFTPAINPNTNISVLLNHDITDFNCEEDSEYDFRQEANYGQISGEGREASFHLIILKYRELGYAKFSINITVFKQSIDDFETIQIPVTVPKNITSKKRKLTFPDGRIHTQKLYPPNGVITGERPQVTITRDANSGPMSGTKVILCGNADEVPQM